MHWRPRTRTYPLQGEEVHALLREHSGRDRLAFPCEHEHYLLDRFDRHA